MKKFANALPLAALLALGVNAQTTDVCPTATVVTITGTITETYCPDCGLTTPLAAPTGDIINVTGPQINITGPEINVNVYVFPALGPAGLTSSSYTVTEQCPCTAEKPPGYIPQGFTTSAVACDVCGEATPTVTLTCPEATPTEWTTYTTAYATPCESGWTSATYTVTEACPCEASRASDYVPSGFTTSEVTMSGETPTVTAITCPASGTAETTGTGSWSNGTDYGSGGSVAASVPGESAGTTPTGTTPETWTGAASTQTGRVGLALFTISAVILAAAIGF